MGPPSKEMELSTDSRRNALDSAIVNADSIS